MDRFLTGHDRCVHFIKCRYRHTMDGLGDSDMQLFNLDLHGYQGQRHTKSLNGSHVSFIGIKGNLELANIITLIKSIKSTLLARPTLVDVFGKYAIIVT